ncbi:hypothetical protein [Desulfitobacterium hafniense]|uniref:Uncharacterized protein n=3 Tax=root TaxID=1 RepID=A0A098AYL4_DESHA|nr:hypothetical protein [Desulfitobacterium hafniense]ACL18731.1 conserved hypothetical protein [Desulfitobacterium hafniense DCB-2]KTE89099.1 hypothetical protein AT727_13820 [Desulfitobacterium hafniense]MEA5024276.1 hypothetical protein [Desulfitobacterium hafniense]CDX00701.1 Hypothetical protein DPCES_0814 [Desulfitobacterium hafniense]
MKVSEPEKIEWQGTILSVQPRTTVWRYRLDNRTHYHRGYNLFIDGKAKGMKASFSVAISEIQQKKLMFRIGDEAKGTAWTKMYDVSDYADYYRAGGLKITRKAEHAETSPPPYLIEPPDLATYAQRGARMLSAASYRGKCFQCAWATMSAVEIEYNWGVSKKYRFESFCYGPKSCKLYKMGKPRAVPYKGDGSTYDEGWMDDLCTENRGWDD